MQTMPLFNSPFSLQRVSETALPPSSPSTKTRSNPSSWLGSTLASRNPLFPLDPPNPLPGITTCRSLSPPLPSTTLLPSSPSKSSFPNPPSIPRTLESWDLPAFPFPRSEPILVSSPCSYGAHLDWLRDCSESLPTLPSPPQWGHFHFRLQSSWEFQSEVTPSDQLRSGIQWGNPSTAQLHHHYRLQQQQIMLGGIFLLGCSVEWWQLFWLDLLLFDDSYVPCIWMLRSFHDQLGKILLQP